MGLTVEEFNLALSNKIEEVFGDLFTVERSSVMKNNNTKRNCLLVRQKELNVSSVIYTDEEYREYCKGATFDNVAKQVISLVERQNKKKSELHGFKNILKDFVEWEKIEDRVFYKIVRFMNNTEYLYDKPYVKHNDLAIVFGILVDNNKATDGVASITVSKQHMANWNINICDLLSAAIRNTPVMFPKLLRNMEDILREAFRDFNPGGIEDNILEEYPMFDTNKPEMYVLSNTIGVNGASAIFYPNCMKDISKELGFKKIVIIPSSIHEVILVEYTSDLEATALKEMIMSVNAEQVPIEEILSDHPYIYDSEADKIFSMK